MGVQHTWRFCAVGNIKPQHADTNGQIYYGTKAFTGGTKVYIDDRTYRWDGENVSVIGLNRFGRYVVDSVPLRLIENIRVQKVFKPKVLKIMYYLEFMEGWPWRKRTAQDRKELLAFEEMWKARTSE